MHIDAHTIDRIVAGVLTQLAADGHGARVEITTETRRHGASNEGTVSREATPTAAEGARSIAGNVITADVLLENLNGQPRIIVSSKAIVTPAAWDTARERCVEIVRADSALADSGLAAHLKCAAKPEPAASTSLPLLVVVRSTDAVTKLYEDLQATWRRELLGCPDEAAKLATSAICRGEASRVVILAEQTHRAACLANRNDRVKAVAAGDAGAVRSIKKQLRANVWCIDPTNQSWFELRNLFRAIANS